MKSRTERKKIVLFIILAMVLGQGLLAEGKSTDSKDYSKTIKLAGDHNHPPYEYIDDNGIFKGFNIDIINAIANEMDLKLEIIPMEWSDAILALDNNEVDGIIGMSQNQERLEKYRFISPTVINEQVIFTRKDTVHINELADLQGLKMAYQKNDYNESIILEIPNITPYPKRGQDEALAALEKGEVDATMGNKLVGLYYLQKNKMTELIKVVGEPISTVKYGPVVGKDNEELLQVLEKGLEAIKRNKLYDKIYKKWFGEDISLSLIHI